MRNHTILLVDASGSMSGFEKETREAIFNIITDLDKETHFKLIFFDTTTYNELADDFAPKIPPQLGYLFKAAGGTPITDSIYKAIQDATKPLTLQQLNEPHKIICFTDGEENSSKHASAAELGAAIEHLTNNFGWNFQFIGPKSASGIKEYTNSIKIKAENVTLYADISEGLKEMQKITSSV